jgi:hypothetical protein
VDLDSAHGHGEGEEAAMTPAEQVAATLREALTVSRVQPAVDVNRIVGVAVAGWVAFAWLLSRGLRRRSG